MPLRHRYFTYIGFTFKIFLTVWQYCQTWALLCKCFSCSVLTLNRIYVKLNVILSSTLELFSMIRQYLLNVDFKLKNLPIKFMMLSICMIIYKNNTQQFSLSLSLALYFNKLIFTTFENTFIYFQIGGYWKVNITVSFLSLVYAKVWHIYHKIKKILKIP